MRVVSVLVRHACSRSVRNMCPNTAFTLLISIASHTPRHYLSSIHRRSSGINQSQVDSIGLPFGYVLRTFIAPSVQIPIDVTPAPPANSRNCRSTDCVHPELVMAPAGVTRVQPQRGDDLAWLGALCQHIHNRPFEPAPPPSRIDGGRVAWEARARDWRDRAIPGRSARVWSANHRALLSQSEYSISGVWPVFRVSASPEGAPRNRQLRERSA